MSVPPNVSSEFMDLDLLRKSIEEAKTTEELRKKIVNAPFEQPLAAANFFLAFLVLMEVNDQKATIDRVALSDTDLAQNTLEVSVIPFEDIKIPLSTDENIIVQAIKTKTMRDTTDWYYTFTPALTGPEARINQASAGIAYTAVYPLYYGSKKRSILSFSYYQYKQAINETQLSFMEGYSHVVAAALARLES